MDQRIFDRVKAYMEKYRMIASGDTVVAGVSGGADSVCLLYLLDAFRRELPFRLLTVHVNHGIREEAAQDASYVEKLCGRLSLPFFLMEEDVRSRAKREKLSEEEAGRNARYEAFRRVLEEQADGRGRIAVAHNANDRVETMLFHLFRGTGLSGAAGIRPVRDGIIRPLLCLTREEIEEYLAEKQIPYCIDRTNLEDTYTRNRIRNHMLPWAEKEICHGAVRHMWESADIFLEAQEYIEKQVLAAYEECTYAGETDPEESIVLKADVLLEKELLIQKQLLLHCLERLAPGRRDIASTHISALLLLLTKQGSVQAALPCGLEAVKEYDRLIIRRRQKESGQKQREEGKGEKAGERSFLFPEAIPGSVAVPGLGQVEFSLFFREKTQIIPEKTYTKWFDYDRITKSAVFRTRQTGDYLTVNAGLSRKSLKDYMINEKIPKSQREDLYVLADGSHIMWVPGYRISHYYKVSENTKRILEVRIRGGQ